jgi:methanethiol S-methyltransferase
MKTISLLYGVVCYLAFLSTFLYAIGFIGNLVVPKTIDSTAQLPVLSSIFIDAALLLVFALQHSIMARPAFKRWWTQFVPEHLERSTYVLLASLCLMLMMWQWQPIGGIVWSVKSETVKTTLFITFFTGWAIVLISTFLINHFDLFGLRQVWLYFSGKPYSRLRFRIPVFSVRSTSFIPRVFDRLLVHTGYDPSPFYLCYPHYGLYPYGDSTGRKGFENAFWR